MTDSHESRSGGFSPEWLALREPADARARDASLAAQLAQLVQLAQRARQRSPARFIDLACGTGANLRYLAPHIGGNQQWLLVDHDSALLERAEHALPSAAGQADTGKTREAADLADCSVKTQRLDLTTDLEALDFTPHTVVTASALLDLVSDRWLSQVIERCRAGKCTVLFALTYDGRIALTPSDPDDEWIRQLVNQHQLGDKGFGRALGPSATHRAGELFRAAGYHVRSARSDWHLLPTEQQLQQQLLEGWAEAARESAPSEADRCTRWLARRSAHVASKASRIMVGHEDLLAWPSD